ncbi:carboxylesterase family protein [Cupriavidus sp. amp6]|uniref:carboxylesterase family protein n=1 Tax=Cupriavidus sp. amp6 TaxID=388051 RepID=UPI001E294D23|nr:carboxylesterase family protein [Cupriavidus sp. amp6]
MKSLISALCGAFAMSTAAASTLTVVKTEGGQVSGTGDTVKTFRGIPYAAAPEGGLRWKPPQAAKPWEEVLDGSRFGPDCPQPAEYPELRGAGMSEDCLRINVWTPAKASTEKLPVMVWIHGGGFRYGSGSHPSYDGEALAKRGVVVVTLNYRLGLLGFLSHPALAAESSTHTSGNYGLMDQMAALRWVKRNMG